MYGGITAETFDSNELWQFSIAGNIWTRLSSPAQGRSMHIAHYRPASHTMVVALGYAAQQTVSLTVEIYDIGAWVVHVFGSVQRFVFGVGGTSPSYDDNIHYCSYFILKLSCLVVFPYCAATIIMQI